MTEIIQKHMYDWSVRIDFYPVSHKYMLVEKKEVNWKIKEIKEQLLSVTWILWIVNKDYLIKWAVDLCKNYLLTIVDNGSEVIRNDIIEAACQYEKIRDKAWDIGTLAHKRAEDFINDMNIWLPENPKVQNAVNGFLEWTIQHNVKFLKSEMFVFSKKYNYVWTADAIAIIDWKKYLIDFKTSNKIDILWYWMQTVAYLKAYEEETGDKLDGIIIVRFSKETHNKYGKELKPFEVQEIIDIDNLYEAFLAAHTLTKIKKIYEKF